jgi:hypothetical protein
MALRRGLQEGRDFEKAQVDRLRSAFGTTECCYEAESV